MRKITFAVGEFYHVFNRGVDKRITFNDKYDIDRFFQSMVEFNVVRPIGSIYENSYLKEKQNSLGHLVSKSGKPDEVLVNFISYCLNPNHYHLLLEQVAEKGIEKFMHRLGNGYTKYFNTKNKRNGSLFQGTYKAVHIESNEQLLHTSVYVNLNNKEYQKAPLGHLVSKSSWEEYLDDVDLLCKKDVILGQFNSVNDYRDFALSSYEDIVANKMRRKELEDLQWSPPLGH